MWRNAADLLYACGPAYPNPVRPHPPRASKEPTPSRRRTRSPPSSPLPSVAGDAVLVKGSLGSRMRLVVQALEAAATTRRPGVKCLVLFNLARGLADQFIHGEPVPLHHLSRSALACLTALFISFLLGPKCHPLVEARCKMAASRSAATARNAIIIEKKGTPTMGGVLILALPHHQHPALGRPAQRLSYGPSSCSPLVTARSASSTTTSSSPAATREGVSGRSKIDRPTRHGPRLRHSPHAAFTRGTMLSTGLTIPVFKEVRDPPSASPSRSSACS